MIVLYFHQHFSTPDGATGTRSYEFSRRLLEHGHEVTVVCGSYGAGRSGLDGAFTGGVRRGTVDGIDVIELELAYSNHMSFWRRAAVFLKFALRGLRIALTHDTDLVFATSTPLTAALPGIAAAWLRRKPFVFEVRDLWPDLPREMGIIRNRVVLGLLYSFEWLAYRSARGCIGLAPGIADGIRRRFPPAERVEMIPNGCDLSLFSPVLDSARPGDRLRVVFAGTHGRANGLGAVLDAAAELQRRGRDDIVIEFIGDGALKGELRERAAREKLRNCLFLDPIPKRELAAKLSSAHVGIQVLFNVAGFYNATSPNKFFDYLACGLPIVTNYPGWIADLIADYQCGIGVRPDDPARFADALERLADNPGQRIAMGANARRLAEEQFDRRALADRFVAFLEECRSA